MVGAERPLAGRTILVTRPAARGRTLVRRLESLGARVDARPTIAFEPPLDRQPARQAVDELASFDWVLFTSPTGVRFFLELGGASRVSLGGAGPRIAAIGPATARALEHGGIAPPTVVASDSRSEGLLAALAGQLARGERVLLVQPEVARPALADGLRAAGARLRPVAFYRTVAAPGIGAVATELCAGCYDLVVFTSPSTFERLRDAGSRSTEEILRALGHASLLAIGEVTAAVLRRAGLRPAVLAASPSDEGIVAAVCALYGG